MKKLLIATMLFIGATTASFAQTSKPAAKPAASKTTEAKKPTAAATEKTGVVLKKDGTPDKRYKNTPAATPLKKDGTPDKRFKANKKS